MATSGRPLSPHLQIYRWYFTMALSIAHRVSGLMLAAGLLLLVWWLVALAGGPSSFAAFQAVTDNVLGGVVLFGLTFVLFFHLLNGIRHLAWDVGYGFELETAKLTGGLVIAVAAALTIVTWIAVLVGG
jgi:succinate dehydrogenase / fumarate reductase cytochrome b subunit